MQESKLIRDLILQNRSYRRFHQEFTITLNTLRDLIDLARLSASARNRQPLKFILSCEPEKNDLIFPHLVWARDLKDWPGPPGGERPSAYIVILWDKDIADSTFCDHGIAAQSILLGAVERNLGGCIIVSIDKDNLRQALEIPLLYEVLLVLALGKPKEKVVIEEVGTSDDIKYWRDSNNVHHVPKRRLDDIIVG
jgi:nitroreductase